MADCIRHGFSTPTGTGSCPHCEAERRHEENVDRQKKAERREQQARWEQAADAERATRDAADCRERQDAERSAKEQADRKEREEREDANRRRREDEQYEREHQHFLDQQAAAVAAQAAEERAEERATGKTLAAEKLRQASLIFESEPEQATRLIREAIAVWVDYPWAYLLQAQIDERQNVDSRESIEKAIKFASKSGASKLPVSGELAIMEHQPAAISAMWEKAPPDPLAAFILVMCDLVEVRDRDIDRLLTAWESWLTGAGLSGNPSPKLRRSEVSRADIAMLLAAKHSANAARILTTRVCSRNEVRPEHLGFVNMASVMAEYKAMIPLRTGLLSLVAKQGDLECAVPILRDWRALVNLAAENFSNNRDSDPARLIHWELKSIGSTLASALSDAPQDLRAEVDRILADAEAEAQRLYATNATSAKISVLQQQLSLVRQKISALKSMSVLPLPRGSAFSEMGSNLIERLKLTLSTGFLGVVCGGVIGCVLGGLNPNWTVAGGMSMGAIVCGGLFALTSAVGETKLDDLPSRLVDPLKLIACLIAFPFFIAYASVAYAVHAKKRQVIIREILALGGQPDRDPGPVMGIVWIPIVLVALFGSCCLWFRSHETPVSAPVEPVQPTVRRRSLLPPIAATMLNRTNVPSTAPHTPVHTRADPCIIEETSSFHLRPAIDSSHAESRTFPAHVRVEVLEATEVRRHHDQRLFHVRVVDGGANGYMFLTEREQAQCGL